MKKIIKKLLLLMGFLFVGSFFVGNNITFAKVPIQKPADNTKTADSQMGLYQTLGRSLYTVTWPLIVIAGQFMDNQVVYGSFVGMDTLLWKIWNVMRTFANYIIGLILIFSIFTLFLGGKLEQFNPIKIIPQLVVSAILVNASWFLIGACIDVSNILTYSVGTLPIKIAGEKVKNFDKQTIPTFGISLQSGNKPLKTGIYTDGKILPFCEIKALTGDAGIKYIGTTGGCVVAENMKYYKVKLGGIILKKGQNLSSKLKNDEIKGTTFSEIQKKLGGMTGILGSLYGSITNLGSDVNYNSGSSTSMSMELILKLLFLFALVIPLFTLAILLIVRVVVLWMFIIISPIVFLFTSVKNFEKFLGEKGKLSSLCCMVFMPVIVVFSLSISFVFLTSLKNMNISNEFGITGKGSTAYIDINGTPNNIKDDIALNFKLPKGDSSLNSLFLQLGDTLSWIIRSIFSIGFMWVIVFAALKSCKITGGIASSIQNFSQQVAKAAPVIPTGVAGGQSVSSLGAGLERISTMPKTKQQTQFKNGIGKIIEEYQRDSSGTGDSHYIAQTSKAISSNFSKGSIAPSKLDNFNNKKNNYGDKKISDLIGTDRKATKLLGDVAASLGMTPDKLKTILKGKTGTLSSNIKDIKKEMTISELKKILQNLLKGSVTLLQLPAGDKTKLENIFNSNGYTGITIGQDEKLAKALKDMGFSDKNIIMLLANKIEGTGIEGVSEGDVKAIKKLLN